MNHYKSNELEKDDNILEAVQVCIDGLLDEDTHLSELLLRPLDRRHTLVLSNQPVTSC